MAVLTIMLAVISCAIQNALVAPIDISADVTPAAKNKMLNAVTNTTDAAAGIKEYNQLKMLWPIAPPQYRTDSEAPILIGANAMANKNTQVNAQLRRIENAVALSMRFKRRTDQIAPMNPNIMAEIPKLWIIISDNSAPYDPPQLAIMAVVSTEEDAAFRETSALL